MNWNMFWILTLMLLNDYLILQRLFSGKTRGAEKY